MKIKVGIVGLGIGRLHLSNYLKCKNVEVIAICDINKERLIRTKEEFNIPYAFENYEDLLSIDEISVVSICTPNYLHKSMTIEALRAGKHVLCEKPMALNAQEAREMVDEAKKVNKKLMINFNQRFYPESRFLKEQIANGELGELYYIKTGWMRRKPSSPDWMLTKYPIGWFCNKSFSGGGCLIDIGVHMLDLALWFLDMPKPEIILGSTYIKFNNEIAGKHGLVSDVEDLATVYIKFSNDVSLFLEVSWISHISEDVVYTSIIGTKGGAKRVIKEGQPSLYLFKDINWVDINLLPNFKNKVYETPQEHFINCILQDKLPIASGEEGVKIMEILDAIYKSASTGKCISFL